MWNSTSRACNGDDESLYERVGHGDIEAVLHLHGRGARLEWRDESGRTPLFVACNDMSGVAMVKTLLRLGANPNAPGPEGRTPLHLAAKRGLLEIVESLLSYGANPLSVDGGGQTPLDVARNKQRVHVVRVIEHEACWFSGWLKLIHGPDGQSDSEESVYVVVLPWVATKNKNRTKLELDIYSHIKEARPRTIISLRNTKFEEPNFNRPNPVATISDITKIPGHYMKKRAIDRHQQARSECIKFGALNASENHILQRFSNAVKGTWQEIGAATRPVPSAPLPTEEDNAAASSCVICMDAPKEGALFPCGHRAGCMACLGRIMNERGMCPICDVPVRSVERIYDA